jgi:phenylpropionate dioxygenase-like ring-hydroxylating dioxygenase large terminal subunit
MAANTMLSDPLLVNDWLAVSWSASVMPGKLHSVRLLGRDLVLWRSTDGLRCWADLCIHRGARLSLGRIEARSGGECVVCPYHGWEYDGAGACVRIPAQPDFPPPARARVESYAVREKYGIVWVCLGEARVDVPAFPEAEATGFRTVATGPYVFRAQGPRIIENFLDVSHLSITHAGLLGDPARTEIGEYEVRTTERGIVSPDIPIWQPDPDGTGRSAEVYYTFVVERPLTARFLKRHGSQNFAILGTVTPVDLETSLSWIVLAMDYAHDVPEESLREFQDRVTEQDIRIVESQRPELLPLDLQAELHLRSDRLAIAYRRWLQQIGLEYGTRPTDRNPGAARVEGKR